MPEIISPKNTPYTVNVKEGESYYRCSCGRSKNQPFCDSSHEGTGFQPIAFTAEKIEAAYLCGCKKTGSKPFFDGTHHK